jgi:hypothetical protein
MPICGKAALASEQIKTIVNAIRRDVLIFFLLTWNLGEIMAQAA